MGRSMDRTMACTIGHADSGSCRVMLLGPFSPSTDSRHLRSNGFDRNAAGQPTAPTAERPLATKAVRRYVSGDEREQVFRKNRFI